MKTLYININGDAIQSDENIEVIGSTEDAIVDSFYISLGMAIADGVTGIKYKPLVADFAKTKPEEFKSFRKQWNEIKAQLLGDNPSGDVEFILTPEYLEWLKMNGTYFTIYNKKYQGLRQAVIKLSLDELYEDTVDAIRRKVIRFLGANDNYKNFNEFVVNDDAVTRRSLLVRSIKDKFEDIAFVLYEKWLEDWGEEYNNHNKLTEYNAAQDKNTKQEKMVCEKCSSKDLTILRSYEKLRDVGYHCNNCGWEEYEEEWVVDDELHKFFPIFSITLGESDIDDAANCGIANEPYIYGSLGCKTHEDWDLWDVDDSAGSWINEIEFRKPRGDEAITVMEITRWTPMISKWKDIGFDWNLSYTEWYNLFVDMGYDIRVDIEPQKEFDDVEDYWFLRARFRAYAPDDTIQFYLHFSGGKDGYQQNSKNTLYSIEVYSRNSTEWE